MKRRYKILIFVVFILSIIWCTFNISNLYSQRNWITSDSYNNICWITGWCRVWNIYRYK